MRKRGGKRGACVLFTFLPPSSSTPLPTYSHGNDSLSGVIYSVWGSSLPFPVGEDGGIRACVMPNKRPRPRRPTPEAEIFDR